MVNNQVVVITLKDSKTKVKGLANLQDGEHCAEEAFLSEKYTRQALVNMGIIHTKTIRILLRHEIKGLEELRSKSRITGSADAPRKVHAKERLIILIYTDTKTILRF